MGGRGARVTRRRFLCTFAARRIRTTRAPPRRLCFQSRTKNSLLSRGKKIHRGVTWRIRKLPTCDSRLKTRTRGRRRARHVRAPPPRSRKHTAPRVFSRSPPDHHVCHLLLRRDGASRVVAPDPARLAPRGARGRRRAARGEENEPPSADPRFRRTTDDPIPDRSVVHSQVVRAPRVAAARRASHNGVAVRCARSTTRHPRPAVPSSASRSPRRGGNI